jgi:hypothetical protein
MPGHGGIYTQSNITQTSYSPVDIHSVWIYTQSNITQTSYSPEYITPRQQILYYFSLLFLLIHDYFCLCIKLHILYVFKVGFHGQELWEVTIR